MSPAPLTRLLGLFALCSALALLSESAVAADPAYTLTRTEPLGAPDRWDYLHFDAPSNRLYIAHGDRVSVINAATGEKVGAVEGVTGGTHGVVIDHRAGKGFTDDGRNGEVVVFDLKTLAVTAHVKVDPDADAMVFDPASGHVFVIEGDPHKIVVIDPATDAVLARIDAGDGLEFGASDGRGHLFVNGTEKREVLEIDTATNAIAARWPVPDCESPHGLALEVHSRRIFTSCENSKLFVLSAETGKIIADLPIGRGSDAVAFDPERKLVFSSDGAAGSIAVIREEGPDRYEVLEPIKTAVSGRTMAVDPETGRLFVVAADLLPNPNGGRPHAAPGSVRLLILDPARQP